MPTTVTASKRVLVRFFVAGGAVVVSKVMLSWDDSIETLLHSAPQTDAKYVSLALPNLKRTVKERPPAEECINFRINDGSLPRMSLAQCFPNVISPPMYVDVWLVVREQVCAPFDAWIWCVFVRA